MSKVIASVVVAAVAAVGAILFGSITFNHYSGRMFSWPKKK